MTRWGGAITTWRSREAALPDESDLISRIEGALAAGGPALRQLGRQLAGGSEPAALVLGAQWLREHAPPSIALPYGAAFLAWGRQHAAAVELYEEWLAHAEAPEAWHLAHLARSWRRLGNREAVYRTAARMHPWDLDHEARAAMSKVLDAVRGSEPPEGFRSLPVALLGTFTTDALLPSLQVGAMRLGLDLDLWMADFDQLRAQILDPSSALYRHEPRVVILATTWRDLRPGASAEEQAAEWEHLWSVLLERTEAHVLQHTFDRPISHPLGHLEARQPGSLRQVASELNLLLAARAPSRVTLVDYEQAMFRFGADRWTDPRQWFWAKEAVHPTAAPWLAEEYVAVLRALTGQTKKVLVLDLDNTMWGGIVGEVGVEGLSVGPPSSEGEAHQALQRYARELNRRGVLLAVCTKNNRADAMAPFEQLPDMMLGLNDFVSFDTGWDPKPQRVRTMARMLNLGLDSFVFVDDNPAERNYMRQECPEVLTIPLGEDPTGYVEALRRARAFEVLSISAEDEKRAESYQAQRKREDLRITATDAESYYASLEMVGTISPFTPADQARIVQLAARSNQFNLTTWRLTDADVARLMASPDHESFVLRMRDRYGDYGLVLVMITEVKGDELDILAFFMSCRVIARSVEQLALAELDRLAIARGCRTIRGTYLPTKKNRELVSELYGRLGFALTEQRPDGSTVWHRTVDPGAPAHNPWIQVERPQ